MGFGWLQTSRVVQARAFNSLPIFADLHFARTCAQQTCRLTRRVCVMTSVKKTLAVIASRSAAVFDQLKYQFILRYQYVKQPFVFKLDANKSLHKFIYELGKGGAGTRTGP